MWLTAKATSEKAVLKRIVINLREIGHKGIAVADMDIKNFPLHTKFTYFLSHYYKSYFVSLFLATRVFFHSFYQVVEITQ